MQFLMNTKVLRHARQRSKRHFQNETVRGTAVDVDENGSLAVQTENGIIHVTSGEVSVRGIYGYI